MLQLHVAGPARRDIAAILKRSVSEFGHAASVRYKALLNQALRDIAADPLRPGAQARPDIMISEARTYHISLSRSRVPGVSVKEPRHLILYRLSDGVIEVARVIHDSRDLARHLPGTFRSS